MEWLKLANALFLMFVGAISGLNGKTQLLALLALLLINAVLAVVFLVVFPTQFYTAFLPACLLTAVLLVGLANALVHYWRSGELGYDFSLYRNDIRDILMLLVAGMGLVYWVLRRLPPVLQLPKPLYGDGGGGGNGGGINGG